MSLITAHKILIAAAVALFVLYAGLEVRGYAAASDAGALFRGGASLLAAIGFGLYYRTIR